VNSTQLLRAVPLFDGFSNDDLVALSQSMHTRAFKAGQAIFAQGDSGRTMYIIERGRVDIHLPGDAEGAILLRNVGLGEFFGELSLFDDKPRSASAIAATDAVLLELEHENLEKYFEIRPHAAIALLRAVSGYVRRTNALLSTRAATNADEEFARTMTWSDRLADIVAELNGSWKFILLIILITAAWCLVNSNLMVNSPPDPYPYQFFNLALAILVALQVPLIVMSQKREAKMDRARADTDFRVNLKNEVNIETVLRELRDFRAEAAGRRGPLA
jgi:CRP/FNR family cyclic AMP-dependent transcriptional regulator